MMSPPPSHLCSPLLLSPPLSPPPLTTIPSTPQGLDSECPTPTPLILSPVPKSPCPKPRFTTTPMTPMKSVINPEPKAPPNTYLSVSGQRIPTKSKTDDLERYIAEIEAEGVKPTSDTNLQMAPPVSRKYTRRKYTDNRHPTTELPDMTSASTGAINVASTTTSPPPERPALVKRRTQQLA